MCDSLVAAADADWIYATLRVAYQLVVNTQECNAIRENVRTRCMHGALPWQAEPPATTMLDV